MSFDKEFVESRLHNLAVGRAEAFEESELGRMVAETMQNVDTGSSGYSSSVVVQLSSALDKLARTYLAYCKSYEHDPAKDISILKKEIDWLVNELATDAYMEQDARAKFVRDAIRGYDLVERGLWNDELIYAHQSKLKQFSAKYIYPAIAGGITGLFASAWSAAKPGLLQSIQSWLWH